MLYSAEGSNELTRSWQKAANEGGTNPEITGTGKPRRYRVDAYVEVTEDIDGGLPFPPERVSNVWFSKLSDDAKRPLLKELGLPINRGLHLPAKEWLPAKNLIYKDSHQEIDVVDFKIVEVWNQWYGLSLRFIDGSISPFTIHSMYFAQMNSPEAAEFPTDFVVFDLETTSASTRTAKICEMAALRCENGLAKDSFESLVHIDGRMPARAMAINGITDEMLAEAPHMREAMADFLAFIGTDSVLVGHNIDGFDLPVLNRVAKSCGMRFCCFDSFDTLKLAKKAWPNRNSYSMDSLRPLLNLKDEGAHRALKDCEDELALFNVAKNIIKQRESAAQTAGEL